MKKSSVFILVIGCLLVLWGAADLYSWATSGKELLELYEGVGSISRLVQYSLVGGIIKVLLGLAAGIVSVLTLKKGKRA